MPHTLTFFKRLKYIYGSELPPEESERSTFAQGRYITNEQNNFLSKLLFFFRKIQSSDETKIHIKLLSILREFSIDVENLNKWLDKILKQIDFLKGGTITYFQSILTKIKTGNIKIDALSKILKENLPLNTFTKNGKFIFETDSIPTISTTPKLTEPQKTEIKTQFSIGNFRTDQNKMLDECKKYIGTMGGKTKKLNRNQLFRKSRKNRSRFNF